MVLINKNILKLSEYPFDKLRSLLKGFEEDKNSIDMSIGQPMHAVPSFVDEIIYKEKVE